MSVHGSITYFPKKGKQNTDELMSIVGRRLERGDVEAVLVATTSGATALRAAELLPEGTRIFGVNFQPAYWSKHPRPNGDIRKRAEELGVVFMPAEPTARYLREISEHVPETFRRLGQGMKVAAEIAMQAVEVGHASSGARVIGIGGTGKGADTAVVILASDRFSDLWISEILAKPL